MAPRPVPPHVFALDAGQLRYARLPLGERGIDLEEYRQLKLGPEVFGEGALGGALREPAFLQERVRELLEQVSVPVEAASMVLPDTWLRMVFAETGDLPRGAGARDEVLRFKLRRLVPYRVEDLRMRYREVPALGLQEEPRRMLLAFGMEVLLEQIENAFDACGVRLGQISNHSLSLLHGVRGTLANLDLAAAVHAWEGGYSLIFTSGGDPVVYRYKASVTGLTSDNGGQRVVRDLKLTRKFVQDRLDGVMLRRVVLVSPQWQESGWQAGLEEVFGVPVNPIATLPAFANLPVEPPVEETAPLFGAASRTA